MIEDCDWIVVSNPTSGRYGVTEHGMVVAKHLSNQGFRCITLECRSNSDFRVNFSELLRRNRPRRGVIIIGGDGTVHQTVNIMYELDASIPFGIIPLGTGNDFAMQCGLLNIEMDGLLEIYTKTPPVEIDVIKADHRICLQIMSTGFDAEVSERSRSLPAFLKNLRYLIALLIELSRLMVVRYEIEIDGVQVAKEALMVSCANGRNYGGGMLLSPSSNHQDGIFELVVLHPVSRLELLRVFPKIFTGGHISHPAFEIIPFRHLRLRADTIGQGDGEGMFNRPLNVSLSVSTMKTWKV